MWYNECIANKYKSLESIKCSGLLFIVIWNSACEEIPINCFAYCSTLKQFDFLKIKKMIWDCDCNKVPTLCFANCSSLEHLSFNNIKEIRIEALANCNELKEVSISDKVENIEVDAFKGCPNMELTFI